VSGYLLDTNVISALSPTRPGYDGEFTTWLIEQEKASAVFLSAMIIEEMARGIHLLEAKGATAKAGAIGIFLDELIAGYADRILPLDVMVARVAGRLEAKAMSAGHNPGAADAVIGGTAAHHGLTVVTRNLRHFQPFEIPLLSPDEWCR
jgi:predicted nucleic acid-binding protein